MRCTYFGDTLIGIVLGAMVGFAFGRLHRWVERRQRMRNLARAERYYYGRAEDTRDDVGH